MVGGNGFAVDVIADCGKQTCTMSEPAHQVVEYRGDGGFAVSSSHAHQLELFRRMTVEVGRQLTHHLL